MSLKTRRILSGTGLLCALALLATACGGSSDASSGPQEISEKDIQAALEKGGTITVWAWEPTLKSVAADFQKKYPKVKVDLVNSGTSNDAYTALSNAVSAGKGVPDVAQIEYFALGQYTLSKSLTDLSGFGAEELAGRYTPGPWNAVASEQGVHGLPMDSGPMAMFYNKKVFDQHGIEAPTTWDEYVEAGRKLHRADPDAYITSDTGDAGMTASMLWQAGSRPFKANGSDITVDFSEQTTAAYTGTWQKLISEDLVAPVKPWTDEWYQGLGDGTIATLISAAWMPANFASGVKGASGDWRVAPLPQWTEGGEASAENGGSSLVLPEAGKNEALAYAFIEYANAGDGVKTRIAEGAFPATKAELDSEAFRSTEFEYFGGQQANKIFAESAARVSDDWTYLPYQAYANSVFNDTAGQAYVSDITLAEGLRNWEKAIVKYGTEQGFSVNK
ncbi:extracellular solute-binding protein [Streptomyces peucetius]|uniref:Extracellular solute-binding protein n=1 Tax=Streptomyces peucetius TaxID=1950 RepID=A0ABY6IFK4_STRPE|nr:extracellular solute-binding protein [Streptomyces peucetius]UYQ65795.1 extracellular solute-binding protein [Streptomyces peucetius]